MEKIKNGIMKIFDNVDKVLKGFSIFAFVVCMVIAIVCLFIAIVDGAEDYLFIVAIILVASSVLSLPLYAFGEIVTQLKRINEKIK